MVWRAALVTGSLLLGGFVLMLLVAVPLGDVRGDAPALVRRPRCRSGSASRRSRRIRSSSGCCCSSSSATGGSCSRLRATAPSRSRRHRSSRRPPGPRRRARRSRAAASGSGRGTCSLPWLTFALFFVALYMRIVRARMLEVLEEPWVRTARAKGASELRVIRVARAAERDRAGRDDGRDGRRDGDRGRDVHRDRLRPAGARPDADPGARRAAGLRPDR